MIRRIVKIDEEKCTGCGLCVSACHEGAIELINGKARLLREDYCDGLGDCLPACPEGAISFENREAEGYNEAAVLESKNKKGGKKSSCQCPGTIPRAVGNETVMDNDSMDAGVNTSRLTQWPVQIKLVPPNARFLSGSDLLIAADCTAYAFGDFYNTFIKNRVTIIGCPKLDNEDYSKKLTEIFKNNAINSVTVVRMTVPCCGGIEYAVRKALRDSNSTIPCQVITISPEGEITDINKD